MSIRTMLANAFVKQRYPCCKLLFAPTTGEVATDLAQGATLTRQDGEPIALNSDGSMVLGNNPVLVSDLSDIDGTKDFIVLMVSTVGNESGYLFSLGDTAALGNLIGVGRGGFPAVIKGGVEFIMSNTISMVEIVPGNVYQYTDATNTPFGNAVDTDFMSASGFNNAGNNTTSFAINSATATELTVSGFTGGVAENAGENVTIGYADRADYSVFNGGLGLAGMAIAANIGGNTSHYSLTSANVFATDSSGLATPLMRDFNLPSQLSLLDGNLSFFCVLQFADGLPSDLEMGIESMLVAAREHKLFTVYTPWEGLRG